VKRVLSQTQFDASEMCRDDLEHPAHDKSQL